MVAAPAIIGSARIRNDATSELRLCSTASPLGPRPNITYEEYHPYGTTAWWASASGLVSQKRYRYTGKEKDTETGLAYHGARYYAPWLARWERPDPSGMADGPNRFSYGRANPVRYSDRTGNWSFDEIAARIGVGQQAVLDVALEDYVNPLMAALRDPSALASKAGAAANALTAPAQLAIEVGQREGALAGYVEGSKAGLALARSTVVGAASHALETGKGVLTAAPTAVKAIGQIYSGELDTAKEGVRALAKAEGQAIEAALTVVPALGAVKAGSEGRAVIRGLLTDTRSAPDLAGSLSLADETAGAVSVAEESSGALSVAAKAARPLFPNPKNQAIADYIESVTGLKVTPNPLENVRGAGRQGDAFIAGVKHEFKTLDPGATNKTISNVISKGVAGEGQARNFVIDARGSGLSFAEAQRGVYRASGGFASKLDHISVIGDDYFWVGGPRR